MAYRVLLDTNVLLDFALRREGYAVSRQLVEMAVKGRVQAFVTPSIVQVVGHCLREAYGPGKAKQLLMALLSDVTVIDIGHEIVVNALHSQMDDMDDALPYYAALHHKLDYFISRNSRLSAAAIPLLPVCTPEAFLTNNM